MAARLTRDSAVRRVARIFDGCLISLVVATTAWLACGALVVWLHLAFFRGGFWHADQRLPFRTAEPDRWPVIAAVIPARNEVETIARAVRSIARQDYPATIAVVVVDDGSEDATAAAAKSVDAASAVVDVIAGRPLPDGWTGKMWAVAQGIDRAAAVAPDAEYLLLTDADIEHAPDSVRRLVAKACAENLDLVSLMVMLRVQSAWERLLIPAFVFFFQKLFPFPWVNIPGRKQAAAAGGCMLVKRTAIARIGGISAIRGRVIDDCALAAAIKPGGPIWLGLAEDSHSLRGYDGLRGLWDMVARTAFVQLRNSYGLLFGTVLGMVVLYLIPPMAVLVGVWHADLPVLLTGLLAWGCMTYLYLPTLGLYGEPPWRALLLPVAALLYTAMTVDSGWRTWCGRGARWKGRSYGPPTTGPKGRVAE